MITRLRGGVRARARAARSRSLRNPCSHGGVDRRSILLGLASLALAPAARAQERPGWSATGPLDGREPVDPTEPTAEERRHVPVLVLPRAVRAGRPFDFVIQVGLDPHVMTPAHHVEWVELAVGEERVFVADLGARVAYPIVRVPIVLSETAEITVRARCNLHGTWRTRRAVTVA